MSIGEELGEWESGRSRLEGVSDDCMSEELLDGLSECCAWGI